MLPNEPESFVGGAGTEVSLVLRNLPEEPTKQNEGESRARGSSEAGALDDWATVWRTTCTVEQRTWWPATEAGFAETNQAAMVRCFKSDRLMEARSDGEWRVRLQGSVLSGSMLRRRCKGK